mmetsp:Transcript_37947/g.72973  ORF Transcript_37947/g.72973 Transcript_37947/m.72973 type:complete len:143 (+) Transcript_37947:290-718(+)
MLEYHEGIIFLTTNRVTCFDPAFKSRISMSLHYQDLDAAGRAKIWKHLTEHTTVSKAESKLDYKALGEKYKMNGRQIRSCIRLAKALAETGGEQTVTMDTIAETAEVVQALDDTMSGGAAAAAEKDRDETETKETVIGPTTS